MSSLFPDFLHAFVKGKGKRTVLSHLKSLLMVILSLCNGEETILIYQLNAQKFDKPRYIFFSLFSLGLALEIQGIRPYVP